LVRGAAEAGGVGEGACVMGDYPYGHRYRQLRAALLGQPCELQIVCEGDPADSVDHSPPVSRHEHREGSNCCVLRPACMSCQNKQGMALANETMAARRMGYSVGDVEFDDQFVQSVEWL